MELIDLQCDSVLKEKFNSFKLNEFCASLNAAKFSKLRKMAQRSLVLFDSTYLYEQIFSLMNISKARYRYYLTHRHLRAALKIANNNNKT